jgi:hydroxymethylglutaryl-CoA reductase
MDVKELFKGFSKLNREQRFQRLLEMGALSQQDVEFLKKGGVHDMGLADNFIENSIGYFQLPLGVATNFVMDCVPKVVPMAVEETSIIAAASKTARWVSQNGRITTKTLGETIIGQIQIGQVQDFDRLQHLLTEHKQVWISEVNEQVAATMVKRGGGVEDIQLRRVQRDDGGNMAVFHVYFNPCDAMGANMINQVCEYLKSPIEELSGEQVTMCILSNLVDSKLTVATVELHDVDPVMGEKIAEASRFAECDPYRAATNNKGVLNGIDPILIATGNDWRAVEAGVHAYAARSGQYRSITQWRYQDGTLTGLIKAPLIVGTVGGVTSLHPTARLCLEMLDVQSASELSRICAAVGLVQNLGALKALTTVGIIEGHMKLHIKNLTLGVGATADESRPLQRQLEQLLAVKKRITHTDAWQLLQGLRKQVTSPENSAP